MTENRSLEELVEQFLEQCHSGNAPEVSAFAAAHPGHASELLNLLPLVLEMEGLNAEITRRLPHQTSEVPELPDSDYRLIRRLGSGGTGVVFEALQLSLNRKVAVKLIHIGYSNTCETLSEPECLRLLEHGQIISGSPRRPRKILEQLTAQQIANEQTRLQEAFKQHIASFEERLSQWESEKLTQLRQRLTNLKPDSLEFDRHWQQYRNEKEALAQKKELTLMQARRDCAFTLEAQELFTLQWIVI